MHILLINNNPVVSRLLALCTRDENMVLEEVTDILALERDNYDVIFLDDDSCNEQLTGQIEKFLEMSSPNKKVFFSNENLEMSNFDLTIGKPFLPSQIMEFLTTVEEKEVTYEVENKILDSNEIEKIKVLLDMDEEVEEEELSEETYEERKIEVIKEQLIAEGLEIVGEEEIVEGIVEELDQKSVETSVVTVFSNDETVSIKKKKKMKSRKNKSKKKKIDFTEVELERIEDAVEVAIATLKRKQMRKLLKGKKIDVTIQLEDI